VESELDQLLAFGDSVLDLRSDAVVVGDAVRTRDALEPALLQDAAMYITRDGVDELRAIVARMSCLVDAPEAFFAADWTCTEPWPPTATTRFCGPSTSPCSTFCPHTSAASYRRQISGPTCTNDSRSTLGSSTRWRAATPTRSSPPPKHTTSPTSDHV